MLTLFLFPTSVLDLPPFFLKGVQGDALWNNVNDPQDKTNILSKDGSWSSQSATDIVGSTYYFNGQYFNPENYSLLPPSARRGDPRMNRAVEVKVKEPKMSLLDALVLGGFQYPTSSPKHDSEIFDNTNISLLQRKNQLNRRLRIIKKNAKANYQGTPNSSSGRFTRLLK